MEHSAPVDDGLDTDSRAFVNFKLSPHFGFFELTASTAHPELVALNRELALQNLIVMRNMGNVCESLLEPIRAILGGGPRRVTSGYRCMKLNNLTPGSSVNSQHPRGEAADIAVSCVAQSVLYMAIVPMDQQADLVFKGSIVIPGDDAPFYFHQLRLYPSRGFVHVSLPTGIKDMQVSMEGK